jgi:hypothetical protein
VTGPHRGFKNRAPRIAGEDDARRALLDREAVQRRAFVSLAAVHLEYDHNWPSTLRGPRQAFDIFGTRDRKPMIFAVNSMRLVTASPVFISSTRLLSPALVACTLGAASSLLKP